MNVLALALKFIPAAARGWALLGTAITVIGLLLGLWAWVDHGGYVRGANDTKTYYERELKRIEAENQQAIDDANSFYRGVIERNRLENEKNDETLELNDREAAADPRNADTGLYADSVSRLNRIK